MGQYFAICRSVLVRQCGSDNVEATLFILNQYNCSQISQRSFDILISREGKKEQRRSEPLAIVKSFGNLFKYNSSG